MEYDNSEFVEKLVAAYRNNWLETMAQLVVLKTQLELVTDRLQKSDDKVESLQKQIEARKQADLQARQAQKQEQK